MPSTLREKEKKILTLGLLEVLSIMRVFKEGTSLALAALLTLTVAPVTAAPPNDYPLHDAVWDGDLDRLVELLQTGHDPNEVDRYGQTALLCSATWAQDSRYLYTLKLLHYGASVDAKDSSGATPLHYAAMTGSGATASLLLQFGADVHARTHGGGSSLGTAYIQGYMDIVRLLESYGARMESEAKRRQLQAIGHITNIARNSKRATRGLGPQERSAWIARKLREVREKHGLHDHLSDEVIARIALEEVDEAAPDEAGADTP